MNALSRGAGAISFVLAVMICGACGDPAPIVADEAAPSRTAVVVRAGTADHVLAALMPAPPEPVVIRPRHQCEPGQIRICPHQMPTALGVKNDGLPQHMDCVQRADGVYRFDLSDCATPLVIAFDDAPVEFTQPPGAFAVGPFARTEWVSARTPWLALDRDGSGCIESQADLFDAGSITTLDDNGDGVLDARDAAFDSLVLWADENQDRHCNASELRTLAAAGISAIPVTFAPTPPHAFGSHEGEHAALAGTPYAHARVVDVYLSPMPAAQYR